MSGMNILLLGGGGREHAIADKLSESDLAGRIYAAPGNVGMKGCERLKLDITSPRDVVTAARDVEAKLVIAGPEAPLAAGVGDAVRESGVLFFGPGRDGSMLEASKVWAKEFMARHGVPTAAFDVCRTMDDCSRALADHTRRRVVKADGLAAGKGVFLPETADEALAICSDLLSGQALGGAGASIVIEDFTEGQELSVFAVTDGENYELMTPSRDHKRAFDGDKGPNTGGMGAYTPVTVPDGFMERVEREVLQPTLEGLRRDRIDYKGVIYMGLMIRPNGGVSVVEYNARFGDPETQAVLPLYRGDFGELAYAAASGRLRGMGSGHDGRHALSVVLASDGYPRPFEKGFAISGLEVDVPNTKVFHSGTAEDEHGNVVTAGGRVLCVTGIGVSHAEAKARAYERADMIAFKGMRMRRDIGWSEER